MKQSFSQENKKQLSKVLNKKGIHSQKALKNARDLLDKTINRFVDEVQVNVAEFLSSKLSPQDISELNHFFHSGAGFKYALCWRAHTAVPDTLMNNDELKDYTAMIKSDLWKKFYGYVLPKVKYMIDTAKNE